MIYSVSCTKETVHCARLGGPQYIGCTGRAAKVRFGEHVGSVTQQCQSDTTKPVGYHFRLPGHSHCNIKFLPIERVQSKDMFALDLMDLICHHNSEIS